MVATKVEHGPDLAPDAADDDDVADLEGPGLDKEGSYASLTLVLSRFDNYAEGFSTGVCLELADLRQQDQVLQQIRDAFTSERGHRHGDNVAAPFLNQQVVLSELTLDALLVGVRKVYLVYGDD